MSNRLAHMRRAGKTFYFASLWLENATRLDIATTYDFCRVVDDMADETPPGDERLHALNAIRAALERREAAHPIAGGMVKLIERFPSMARPAIDLVIACTNDLPGTMLESEEDLIRYAHGVAGNVGLMMYPLLGGNDPRGAYYADQLGIAMQCTNIARDVLEDLHNGRIYIPQQWLPSSALRALLDGDRSVEPAVVESVERLLTLASELYHKGLAGLQYLPPRARLAIRIAAECYSAIGSRVIENNRLRRSRSVVSLPRKILLALNAITRPTLTRCGS